MDFEKTDAVSKADIARAKNKTFSFNPNKVAEALDAELEINLRPKQAI